MAGYALASREQNLEGGEGASQAAKASPGLGRAKKGRALPLPRRAKPGSAGSPLGWGPAPVQPSLRKARHGAYAHATSPKNRGYLDCAKRCAKRSWEGRELSACVGLRAGHRAGTGTDRKAQGWEQPLSIRAKPGSGWEPTLVGSGPDSACAVEGAPGGKGVARPKPSAAGEGAASSRRAKPGSGRDPTRVGSDPDSSCSARGALGCMGVAGLKPSDAGEGTASPHPGEAWVRPGAPLDEVRPKFKCIH